MRHHFNFCDNIATQIPTPPCSFSNTMAYRLEDYTPATSATCFNMGPDVTNPSIPQEVTKVDGDASNGVAIKFAISTTTSLTVTLACKEENQGLVTAPAAPGYGRSPDMRVTAAVTTWETYYSCPGAQGDDAAKATASAGQWFAVVAFLVVMFVLSLVWAKNHKEDLGLDTLEHAMIVTSWNVSAERLLAVRCVILAFMFFTFISMIDPVHNGVSGVGGAFFCKLSSCATASRSSASSARHSRSRRLVSPFAPMKLFDAGRGSACAQGSPTGATSCSPCTLPQLSRTV